MKRNRFSWAGPSLLALATAVSSACGDTTTASATAPRASLGVTVNNGERWPSLASCQALAAPEGSTLLVKAFAVGVQIYHWNGTSWGASTPSATLYADAGGSGAIGTHYAGPTWQSNSGGTVVGTVAKRCTPNAAAIPWLSLTAVADGPGVFQKVTFIQRLYTTGGNPPTTPGTSIGEERRVPYTAEYLFYKKP